MRIRGLAVVLLLLVAAVSALGETPPIAKSSARCAHPPMSLATGSGSGHDDPLASVLAPKPRLTTLTDDCLPPGESCVYYASGDCLDCYDDNNQRGTYICDSWVCTPYGALYTCCSGCSRFNC